MIVIAGKNNIAVHGLTLAMQYFEHNKIIVVPNKNDQGIDNWQRSLLKAAKDNSITIRTLAEVYQLKVDLFISLEFDQIIRPEKLETDNVYNIHFSELPKYKGMYTSIWPILYADKQSGVTLHKIDQGIDTGDVIAQKIFTIAATDRSQDCYRKYIDNSELLLSEWFSKIIDNSIKPTKQSAIDSTYFSRKSVDYSNLSIDFNRTAWQIKRQVYAFSFRPYQLLKIDNKAVSDIVIKESVSPTKPGTIISKYDNYYVVSTIDYDIEVHLDNLEGILASISTISIEDFSRGIVNILGVNDRNNKGWSPIIVAAYHGRQDLIEWLLKRGAYINDRNYRGTTVLMYAKDFALNNSSFESFQFLINQGADSELEDWSGKKLSNYITSEQAQLLGVAF